MIDCQYMTEVLGNNAVMITLFDITNFPDTASFEAAVR